MTNVRKAVARRDDAAARAPATVQAQDVVRSAIGTMTDAFDDLLPAGMSEKRFATLVVSACKSTPDLLRCFDTKQGRTTVLLATVQAASLGLEPNTKTEECWLTPRRNRGTWECELQIGWKGYVKLSYRSPRIAAVDPDVVYSTDHFVHERGLPHDRFEHRPASAGVRYTGELTHAYCIVRYTSGGYKLVLLDRHDVEKRRAMSDTWRADQRRTDGKAYSPWNTWEREMWLKSAVRAARAFMDLTAEAEAALDTEGQSLRLDSASGRIVATPFAEVGGGFGELERAGGDEHEADAPPAPQGDGPVAPPASQKQLTAVNTLLSKKHGITGEARFDALADLIGREVTSTSDLTADEAGQVIEQLGALPDMTEQPADGPGTEPFG